MVPTLMPSAPLASSVTAPGIVKKNESDANGVNVRDYRANTNFTTTQATTMLNHNCIETQDDL